MEKTKIKTEKKVIRFYIKGRWDATDFSNFLESLSFLYKVLTELDEMKIEGIQFNINEPKSLISLSLMNIDSQLYKKINFPGVNENNEKIKNSDFSTIIPRSNWTAILFEDLEVKEIKYASPGFTDLAGVGKIMEQLFSLIKHYFPNKAECIQNEILEQDLITKKIKNLKAIGYPNEDLQKLLDTKNSAILTIKQLEYAEKLEDFKMQN